METDIEIIDNNKLIAEFMSLIFEAGQYGVNPDLMPFYDRYSTSSFQVNEKGELDEDGFDFYYAMAPSELRYHKSWDWLMPVVHKCLEICHDRCINEWEESFADKFMSCSLDLMFIEVIDFIKWYNQNQSTI